MDVKREKSNEPLPENGNDKKKEVEEDKEEDYPDECTLFVGDISRSLTEEQLKETFSSCGEVVNVEIKRDRVTRFSLGYAFVQFKSRRQAAEAKVMLHKKVLGNRAIRIGWAQKNTNIFVGDLDPSITSEQLREAFRAFGPIYEEDTFVKHRNYGFVKFKHRAHAEKAKREMDGKMLGNRPIRIGWGDANTQKYCVHIQFNPEEAENLTETDVRKKFEEFGEVVSINLPRAYGELKGYGFIHFEDSDEGEEAAARAIAELNDTTLMDVQIKCNFGKKQHSRGKPFTRKNRQPLYPMQVMMPVGPQGAWQPVHPYMVSQPSQPQYYPLPQGRDSYYPPPVYPAYFTSYLPNSYPYPPTYMPKAQSQQPSTTENANGANGAGSTTPEQ